MIPAQPRSAALHIIGAMAVIGLIDNAVTAIAAEIGLWQFHLLRSAIGLPAIWLLAWMFGARLRPVNLRGTVLRSLATGTAMLLYFAALGFMPVSLAAAGLFTAPIFVLLIARFGFGQGIGPWRVLAVALGFAGVLAVLRPWEGGGAIMAVPLIAAVAYALGAIATREWCGAETVWTLLFGFFAVLGIYGALGAAALPLAGLAGESFPLKGWAWPSGMVWALVAMQALGSILGVGLLFRGYALAPATGLAAFEYTLLIVAGFWGWLLKGEVLGAAELGGMALIVAAGVILALRGERAAPVRSPAAGPGIAPGSAR